MLWYLYLWVIPLLAAFWARARFPASVGLTTGVCFGAIVSPASLGLYSLFYTNGFLALFGLVGLVLSMIHSAPGYHLAMSLGVVPPGMVVEGVHRLLVEILNGLVWSSAYGTLGFLFDRVRIPRR